MYVLWPDHALIIFIHSELSYNRNFPSMCGRKNKRCARSGASNPTFYTAVFTFDFCWLSKWLSLPSLIELWIRFATTIVCHKCVSKQIKSFVIGQNDGWNMGRFISGALFLSFPYLFLSDSCPRAVGEEGGPGLSFEAQQFFSKQTCLIVFP